MSNEEKKTNGLRTAVKNGVLTVEEAKVKLDEMAAASGYKSPEIVEWLRRRS